MQRGGMMAFRKFNKTQKQHATTVAAAATGRTSDFMKSTSNFRFLSGFIHTILSSQPRVSVWGTSGAHKRHLLQLQENYLIRKVSRVLKFSKSLWGHRDGIMRNRALYSLPTIFYPRAVASKKFLK